MGDLLATRGLSGYRMVIACNVFRNTMQLLLFFFREKLETDYPPVAVKNGDIIQLVHGTTGRALNRYATF